MMKIFIDPGHGGSDSGSSANGLQEKDVSLAISLLLRRALDERYVGHLIKLSRETDKTVTLRERTTMANKWGADLLLSIHVNAGGGTGFESFIYNGTYAGKTKTNRHRKFIHNEVVKSTKFQDRGKKTANFHMLRESSMLAVLTENGFIDHKSDANSLKSNVFLNKIADGHAAGLAKALHLKRNDNQKQQNKNVYTIKAGDTLWQVAKENNTSVSQLIDLNPGVDPHRLQIGQDVVIGKRVNRYHTIQKGDTFWGLAQQYGTTVSKLLKLNKGVNPKTLRIGEKVRIR